MRLELLIQLDLIHFLAVILRSGSPEQLQCQQKVTWKEDGSPVHRGPVLTEGAQGSQSHEVRMVFAATSSTDDLEKALYILASWLGSGGSI